MNKVINKTDIFKLKQELHDFLKKHPELENYQKEITNKLNNAGSKYNKMTLLQTMMFEKIHQLSEYLNKIKGMIKCIF